MVRVLGAGGYPVGKAGLPQEDSSSGSPIQVQGGGEGCKSGFQGESKALML